MSGPVRVVESPTDPAPLVYAVTQSDATADPNGGDFGFRALYVGGAGDVKVTTTGGTDATFAGVPAGGYIYARIERVWTTGTTATSILGLR